MTAIVLIGNREAIPVRAIPFVTGWKMPPDKLAWSLAHRDDAETLEGVTAGHLLPNRQIGQVVPKEWDRIIAAIQALTETLQERGVLPRKSRPTWERESVRLLPAGCFVWRDEFEAAFRKAYSPRRRAILDLQRGDHGERAGERDLNFAPLIQDLATAMEGFPGMVRFDPNTEAEHQAHFYGFDEAAGLAGITAKRAAELLNIREGELLRRHGVPSDDQIEPLARRLLTLEELRGSGIDGTIHPLSEWLRRAKEKGIPYLAGLDWAVGVGRVQQEKQPSGKACQVFRDMEKLTADELSIAFVGDTYESGLGANNMLEISARGMKRLVPLAELDLVDRRQGVLNQTAGVLAGMARKRYPRSQKNAQTMSRLRKVLCEKLGIKGNPFENYSPSVGWVPRFKIVDKRGAADERAKREAERRTGSYEEMAAGGDQRANFAPEAYPFESENDPASEWLKDNDQQG